MNANLELSILRRVMVGHLAEAMVDGGYETRKRAWSIATELKRGGVDIEAEAQARIADLGGSPSRWASPAEDKPQVNEQSVRWRLARHIAGAYVSGSNEQFERAKELERELAQAGLLLSETVNEMVLDAMRDAPRNRGQHGRIDDCPF